MTNLRTLPSRISWFLLLLCFGLAQAKRECQPEDWTRWGNFLKFGYCNWPSDESPCGRVVEQPGKPTGQRAWAFGSCALKFSDTPWAPDTWPQEQSNTWTCGTKFRKCKKKNSTEPEFDCGSNVVGTKVVCPSEQDGQYICTDVNKVWPQSNCKGSKDDLVVEVNSLGYPEEIKDKRMTSWEQCQKMCGLRSGCNVWVFCNSTEGCGFSCQDYYNKHNKGGSGMPTGTLVGIIVGSSVAGIILIGLVAFIIYRCCFYQRQVAYKTNQYQPNITPASQPNVLITANAPAPTPPMGTAVVDANNMSIGNIVSHLGVGNASSAYQGQPVLGQVAMSGWQPGMNGSGALPSATAFMPANPTGPRRTAGADHAIW